MIQFDFAKFNETGLKSVIKAFAKYDLKVVSIDADNKPKREAGVQVKSATLEFESGQKLAVKVKTDGGIVQVKLNGKVLGIKHVDDLDKAILEVVDYVQGNEKSFLKAKGRVPKIRPPAPEATVSTSLSDQIDQYQTSLDSFNAQNEDLTAQMGAQEESVGKKQEELSGLQAEIETEQAKSDNLQAELDQLRGEAA